MEHEMDETGDLSTEPTDADRQTQTIDLRAHIEAKLAILARRKEDMARYRAQRSAELAAIEARRKVARETEPPVGHTPEGRDRILT